MNRKNSLIILLFIVTRMISVSYTHLVQSEIRTIVNKNDKPFWEEVIKLKNMKKNMILYVLVGVLVAVIGFNACTPDYETNFEEKTLVVPDKCLSPI